MYENSNIMKYHENLDSEVKLIQLTVFLYSCTGEVSALQEIFQFVLKRDSLLIYMREAELVQNLHLGL